MVFSPYKGDYARLGELYIDLDGQPPIYGHDTKGVTVKSSCHLDNPVSKRSLSANGYREMPRLAR